jgi:hypothetical protein
MSHASQRLCEHVCDHYLRVLVTDSDLTLFHLFASKMEFWIDVLRGFVVASPMDHVNARHVILK